jgi:hypothetical protein
MLITGMNVPVADFIDLRWMLSGRRSLMACFPGLATGDSYGWCGAARNSSKNVSTAIRLNVTDKYGIGRRVWPRATPHPTQR